MDSVQINGLRSQKWQRKRKSKTEFVLKESGLRASQEYIIGISLFIALESSKRFNTNTGNWYLVF